ncbi:NHS-like protein 3 isoform X2 [Sphaeramia orbicularis]|uniref:NHS-like protein 3 isoform X2 n=1 Tax=Sphaeramia orbicularis TaxID=375764 RepID=UPI00117D4916|nr:uncharacterized protein KIAA1522 homolog isoform X2 [Sphaeramia orbicularis]
MGNSIQKKKKIQREKNFSPPHSPSSSRENQKGFWLFGHSDKIKTAGPKGNEDHKRLSVHYTASQHYQENVFIEGSRPQYLEDLHTEAQEGLKILQQEENKNGVTFPDDDTIASTTTLCPQQDISSKDRDASPESRSTTGNTDTTVTSAVSTRPVLTRQGSTFKPLHPVKRIEKTKKRGRRTTIMGIPNQVQKELALHRHSTFQQLPDHDKQVSESQSSVVIIPTVDGGTPIANKEGARVHLSELEQTSRDEKLLKKHLQAVYQEEHHNNLQGFSPHLGPTSMLRPKSVAVPGMTTSCSSPAQMFSFLQEPQGPVMSISPQATYMSTIIPNAVLPASIEVIEIDHGSRTRGSSVGYSGSVRTVSKSSLASGDSSVSPLLSRRSDDDDSQTDISHNTSILMPTSVSGSNLSETPSSKTIISNTSPTFSKGSSYSDKSQRVGLSGQGSLQVQSGENQDLVSLQSSTDVLCSPITKHENVGEVQEFISQSVTAAEDAKNKRNFARSLSIVKTKQPPAPPRRTNSLHNNKIRAYAGALVDSKTLNESVSGEVWTAAENIVGNNEIKSVTAEDSRILTPLSNTNSPDASSDTDSIVQVPAKEDGGPQPQLESSGSSPQKTPSDGGKFERTMSPSSGYSSQSGTPTLSPKGISPTSPDKQKKTPVKPERSVSRASSSAASPSPSLTSLSCGTPEPVNQDVSKCTPSLTIPTKEPTPCSNSAVLRVEIRDLLNIPPPPKVKAPCPPPPETWVHNRHTFELLCAPYVNVNNKASRQMEESTMKQAGTQTESGEESPVEKHTTTDKPMVDSSENREPSLEEQPLTLLTIVPVVPDGVSTQKKECPGTKQEAYLIQDRTEAGTDVQCQEVPSPLVVDTEALPKKDPPQVMKKPMTVINREKPLSEEQSVKKQQMEESSSASTVYLPVENRTTFSQNEVTDGGETASIHTLSINVTKANKDSPPPTPPPSYHPTPPLSRKTPPSSVSVAPDDLQRVQEEIQVSECCWPPPPPPLEGDSVFEGGDDIDFPLPPPPLVSTDSVPEETDKVIMKIEVQNRLPENVEETVILSSDAETRGPVKPPDVLQPVADNKPEVVKEVLQANTTVEFSCRPVLDSSSNNDTPPTLETPPLPPFTKPEIPASVLLSTNSLKQNSVKTEGPTPSEPLVSAPPPITAPEAPPLPVENLTSAVNFRRQPSVANRDTRSKELLSRHKSAPIPKEDANIPLVTPSLLQMVRLRSVNMAEDEIKTPSEDKSTNESLGVQENSPVSTPGPQSTPQKPIRKSLSLKSPPQTLKTSSVMLNTPSMRLQEAIRMKTAAMSSRDGLPSRLSMRTSTYSSVSEPGALSLKSPEGCDLQKSPASTASFIFSRSTKKVVIETAAASSPETQANLKQSLAAELMQFSDHSKAFSNGGIRSEKVPPPVAKKPAHGSVSPSQNLPTCTVKMDLSVAGNGTMGTGQHVGKITLPETRENCTHKPSSTQTI